MIRAVIFCALFPLAGFAEMVPEPDGYRMEDYRGAVPATLQGGTVVDADAAYALWKTGRVGFVDVLPRPPRPADLPEGTIWRDKPRESIPGAIWLPNVGYGDLAEVTAQYFQGGLDDIAQGDQDYPLVFFCLNECWMSWNAARRALAYGYTHVFWFPQGTDGWHLAGYPLERLEPVNGG